VNATIGIRRSLEYWLVVARRTWRMGVTTSFINPVLFLTAIGLGLGSYVDHGSSSALGGVDYIVFLAPGLLASTAMQSGSLEAMWPVMASLTWTRQYHAMASTPLRVRDIVLGHLSYMALRLVVITTAFLVVATAFGAITSWWAVLAIPAAVLTGMAFAAPIAAYSATRTKEGGAFAALNRFVLIPMFLFSGTFFPVSQLPAWIRPIAYVTPLWHGVQLCRSLALGNDTWAADVAHALYLVAFVVGGTLAALTIFRRRLEL